MTPLRYRTSHRCRSPGEIEELLTYYVTAPQQILPAPPDLKVLTFPSFTRKLCDFIETCIKATRLLDDSVQYDFYFLWSQGQCVPCGLYNPRKSDPDGGWLDNLDHTLSSTYRRLMRNYVPSSRSMFNALKGSTNHCFLQKHWKAAFAPIYNPRKSDGGWLNNLVHVLFKYRRLMRRDLPSSRSMCFWKEIQVCFLHKHLKSCICSQWFWRKIYFPGSICCTCFLLSTRISRKECTCFGG